MPYSQPDKRNQGVNVRLCPVQDRRTAHAMHILWIGDKEKPIRMI